MQDKEYIMKAWSRLDPLDRETEHMIRMRGVLTGSSKFGGANTDSDIDYIVRNDRELLHRLNGINSLTNFKSELYKDEPDTDPCYVKFSSYKERPVNLIICTSEPVYRSWVNATTLFTALMTTNLDLNERVQKSKLYRVTLFKKLRDLTEDVFDEMETYKNQNDWDNLIF